MFDKTVFTADKAEAIDRALWQLAFGDTEHELHTMLTDLAEDAHALRLTEQDMTLAQCLAVPITAGGCRLLYLYGVAVHPAYRGRGYLRALIRACVTHAREEDVELLFLLPATEALTATYERLGFVLPLPLLCTADGIPASPDCTLPHGVEVLPFDGDMHRLWSLSARNTSVRVFAHAIEALRANSDIFYLQNEKKQVSGYVLLGKHCRTVHAISPEARHIYGISYPLLGRAYPLKDKPLPDIAWELEPVLR